MSKSFSPYVTKPEIRTFSKYSLEHALEDNDITLPPSHLKSQEFRKAKSKDIDMPEMTDADRECAKRYPIFDMDIEDVKKLAEANGIDVTGMAKIDMCHALNQKNVAIKTSMEGRRKRGCRKSKDGLARNSKGRFCKIRKAKRKSSKLSKKRSARK
jgi:hypothetical protein